MEDVVLIDRLGDITFGLPEDLAPHKKPWAYYDLLGIERNASSQDIKKAVRRLSLTNHPDRFAVKGVEEQARAEERQKLINDISTILLDEGGELGAEWSKRSLYDKISGYGEFFGAGHIEHKGCRTATITENLLDLLELEKRGVESKYHFETENPEIVREMQILKRAINQGDNYSANQAHKRIVEKMAAKEGLTPTEFERRQREMFERHEKRKQERKLKNGKFKDGLISDLRKNVTPSKDKPNLGIDKVFDIWYNGAKDENQEVIFSTSDYPFCSLVGYDESDGVIKMGLEDNATFVGMRKVHFKAQYAHVIINDAHLEGIFQVVNGNITIEYEGSSYGAVIRVRAPKVYNNNNNDFVQQGDLYTPKSFATEKWAEKEVLVDIAVLNGAVNLRLKKKTVQPKIDYGGYLNLNNYYSNISNIINSNNNIKF